MSAPRWVEAPASDGGEPYLWRYVDGAVELGYVVSMTDGTGSWTTWGTTRGDRGRATSAGEGRRSVEARTAE